MNNSMEKNDPEIKKKSRLLKQLKRDALIKTIGSVAALIITFSCVFGITRAPTNDMFPAIHKGDLIVYYRQGKIVKTDVVIYDAPDGSPQIGRVEGIQGETVGKTGGGFLTVNGNIPPVQKRSWAPARSMARESNADRGFIGRPGGLEIERLDR